MTPVCRYSQVVFLCSAFEVYGIPLERRLVQVLLVTKDSVSGALDNEFIRRNAVRPCESRGFALLRGRVDLDLGMCEGQGGCEEEYCEGLEGGLPRPM